MNTRTLPDVEAIAVQHLLTVADVTDIAEERVSTVSPEDVQTAYLLARAVDPRSDNHHWVGTTLMQIDAYADDRDTAFDLCEAAVVGLLDMPQTHALGVVTGARHITGPRRLPDPVASRHHYEAEVELTTHPSRDGS